MGGGLGAEPDEVDDFENAERVDNQQGDKPFLLTTACSVPERISLQNDSPKRHDENEWDKDAHKSRRERRVERRVWLHMRRLYHTLLTMRYLGVDYGSRKVGLALSDEAGAMGFPHAIVTNTPRLVDELCALIAKENVGAVVIGDSRNLAGGDNPIAEDAHALGEVLVLRAGVPVFYESEVFTSAEARRLPAGRQARPSRAPKARADVDASAAALILTSYLAHTHHGPH